MTPSEKYLGAPSDEGEWWSYRSSTATDIGPGVTDPDIIAQAEAACDELLGEDCPGTSCEFCEKAQELLPQLLAEAKAWKAKAIEERAMQKSRFCNDNLDEMRDFWTHDMDYASKNEMIELAARELEEEMRQNG